MSVVGVDLGHKNTVIAAAGRGGVDVLLNGNSNRLNPCMVGFGDARTMGESAGISATSNYKNTITSMKRLVGLAFEDPRAQAEMKYCAFTCVPLKRACGGPDGIGVQVSVNGEQKVIAIEAVAGMMVRHLGTIAAAKAAQTSQGVDAGKSEEQLFPQDWVIAVPSYMTDAQRRGLLAGCEITGINGVQRLMNEHTAVALSYGIFKDLKKEFEQATNVMFIDLGATHYTVSIVTFETGKLVVKSSFFDEGLGGRDFDEMLAQYIASKFEEKYKGKLSAKPMEKPKVRLKILAAAEKAKKTLSPQGVKETRVSLECLMDDLDFQCLIKAEEYAAMAQPLVDRLAKPLQAAMAEAKMTPDDLASVEIVGGTSRIGFVKKALSTLLGGKSLSTTMNADEAVARGAALQSAILSPRFKVLPYEIQEAQNFPIKVSWEGGGSAEADTGDADAAAANSVVMFNRGSNFPVVRRVTLRRAGEFAVQASYDSSSIEYGAAKGPFEICSFSIKAPAGEEKKVRVNVKQDVHGIISLSSAQMVEEVDDDEPSSIEVKEGEAPQEAEKKKKIKKTNLEFTTKKPLDWTKSEIEKAYEAEVAMANADRIVKETSNMRNELESYIYDMRDKIHSDSHLGPYGTDEDKASFGSALETTETWLYDEGFDATKSVYAEKLGELKKIGGPIEARQAEGTARPQAVAQVQHYVDFYKNFANSQDEKYSHITDEERLTVHKKCDEISAWLYEMLDKQGSLALNQNPVVTAAEIGNKSRELTEVCSPIKNKPKPKPAPAPAPEPPKAEETPKPEEAKTAEGEPMETDAPEPSPDKMEVDE
mmetsp:Transcript_35159/g.52268  ORF Transcript_35159/g.52268 Transcript_35159/m.52268 type:complete len:819 (-) Transcript_35159:144-2600(-)|eukprot:CAMPEP_0194039726 /NCGR_PEP_ID=MMETSP0009_2-20130614/11842_1 /TAXON_ID=210454 /ORGANISM="Grammatophora oceanica, Strain CCMP 410" /LENGTH=818 /DNA_ID=CAMNT_0038682657 /DNA_START=39 /DNA_END=2495 /DNA_ORIENTATION=-